MTIELTPELEELVQQRAKQDGVDVRVLVAKVLQEALGLNRETLAASPNDPQRRAQLWQEFMDEVDHSPLTTAAPLSDEDLSRESIYDDDRHRI